MNHDSGGPSFHQQGLFERQDSFQTPCKDEASLKICGSPCETSASQLLPIKDSALEKVIMQKSDPLL
jgi:hypothetical protein